MRGRACTYEVYRSGRYQGVFTAAEIEKLCGIRKNQENRYAREETKYAGKWSFSVIGDAMTRKEIKKLCL